MSLDNITVSDQVVVIKPCGGFGNRMIGLIGGIFLSRLLNCKAYVYWVPCHLCDCEFNDIFSVNDITLLSQQEYDALKLHRDITVGSPLVKTNNTIFNRRKGDKSMHVELLTPATIREKHTILYVSHVLPNFITKEDIIDILGLLLFKKEIYELAYSFIKEHNITSVDRGYHGRFTDCYNRKKNYKDLNSINKQSMFDTILNSNTRYFVCSCERELESELVNIKNVIFRPKDHYPVFYTSYDEVCKSTLNLNKRGLITADTLFPLNYISKNAVIDGIVDMLILSRTNMVKAISSTFWDLAEWYSRIYIGKSTLIVNGKRILLL